MPTLYFWDKAPDRQWPVAKLVQEFYKEIYPAHPDGVMAGDLPYHRLWRLAMLSSTVISPKSFMALLLQHLSLPDTCARRPSSSYPRAILLRLFSTNQLLFLKSPIMNLLGLPP
ncbi:hypothetical protein PQX77_015994 [Marasmius sp. AFHP31]|nr:hypothetical protein PQX77_015994 [Marasmius sp. AFHP31]